MAAGGFVECAPAAQAVRHNRRSGGQPEFGAARISVLRLLETFRLEEVEGAVGDALRLGAIGFDAVKHLVLCRIERRPPRLNLDVYPYNCRAPGSR